MRIYLPLNNEIFKRQPPYGAMVEMKVSTLIMFTVELPTILYNIYTTLSQYTDFEGVLSTILRMFMQRFLNLIFQGEFFFYILRHSCAFELIYNITKSNLTQQNMGPNSAFLINQWELHLHEDWIYDLHIFESRIFLSLTYESHLDPLCLLVASATWVIIPSDIYFLSFNSCSHCKHIHAIRD